MYYGDIVATMGSPDMVKVKVERSRTYVRFNVLTSSCPTMFVASRLDRGHPLPQSSLPRINRREVMQGDP